MAESSFLIAAEAVLSIEGRPMATSEIIRVAAERQLLPDNLNGLTLHKTLTSKLSQNLRRLGSGSRFARVGQNRFVLRDQLSNHAAEYVSPPQLKTTTETVAVVPANYVRSIVKRQGFVRGGTVVDAIASPSEVLLIPRATAEASEQWKQLTTYCLVYVGGDLVSFERGNYTNVEKELRGRRCIGFGGHVNSRDVVLSLRGGPDLASSAARELREELHFLKADGAIWLPPPESIEFAGVINDDSSPAGRRHLAVVCRCVAPQDVVDVAKGEKSVNQIRRHRVNDEHGEMLDNAGLEYWSEISARALHASNFDPRAPLIRAQAPRDLTEPYCIIVVGEIGSGKSELSESLAANLDATMVNSGRVVASILGRPPASHATRRDFQTMAEAYLEDEGLGRRLGVALLEAAGGAKRSIVDGIRLRSTLETIKSEAANNNIRVLVLFVETPPHRAYDFYCERENARVEPSSFFDLREAPVEREVRSLIEFADAIVYNSRGRREYKMQALQFVKRLLRNQPPATHR